MSRAASRIDESRRPAWSTLRENGDGFVAAYPPKDDGTASPHRRRAVEACGDSGSRRARFCCRWPNRQPIARRTSSETEGVLRRIR